MLSPSPTRELQILIIDDEPSIVHVLARTLLGMGMLRFAVRGEDALRVLAEDPQDLVLTDADIAVLDHPLNHKHGRAPQLAAWGLAHATRASLGPGPVLLVASSSDEGFRDLLAHYHALCEQVGPLPTPVRARARRCWA